MRPGRSLVSCARFIVFFRPGYIYIYIYTHTYTCIHTLHYITLRHVTPRHVTSHRVTSPWGDPPWGTPSRKEWYKCNQPYGHGNGIVKKGDPEVGGGETFLGGPPQCPLGYYYYYHYYRYVCSIIVIITTYMCYYYYYYYYYYYSKEVSLYT